MRKADLKVLIEKKQGSYSAVDNILQKKIETRKNLCLYNL